MHVEQSATCLKNKDSDEPNDAMGTVTNKKVEYRQKLVETILILWNMTTMGMLFGQIGPALPDLQRITGSSLKEAALLFTGFGIGYIIGCLLPGRTFDRFNARVLQFLHTLGTAITTAVLPWSPILYVSVAVRVIQGITVGCQGAVSHIMIFQIWTTSSGPYIQLMYTALGVGGLLSPLYTQPFLGNVEEITGVTGLMTPSMINSTVTAQNTTKTVHLANDIRIHFAFLISAALSLSSSLAFLFLHVFKVTDPSSTVSDFRERSEEAKLQGKMKYLILVLMHMICFFASGCILNFQSLLATFLIRQLNMSPQSASTLTSVYYGMYGMGNLFGSVLLKLASVVKLITVNYVGTVTCVIACMICSLADQTVAVWVFIAMIGLTMAVTLPALYTWIEENIAHVTGRLASSTLFAGAIGLMVYPTFAGYLMDTFSPMWFLYVHLSGILLCAFLFAVSFTLSSLTS